MDEDSLLKLFKMFVLVSFLFSLTYGLKCPRGFYYDCGTNSCENCSNICTGEVTQEMEDKCWRLCRHFRKESKTSAKSTLSETATSKTTDSMPEDKISSNTPDSDEKTFTDSLLAVQQRRLADVLLILGGIIVFIVIGYFILKFCYYQNNNQNGEHCQGSCNLNEIIVQKKLRAATRKSPPLTAV